MNLFSVAAIITISLFGLKYVEFVDMPWWAVAMPFTAFVVIALLVAFWIVLHTIFYAKYLENYLLTYPSAVDRVRKAYKIKEIE